MQLAAAGQQLAAAAPAQRAAPRGSLRLFLDCADVRLWESYAQTGTLHGVTTNPLILQRDRVACSLASARTLLAAAQRLGLSELQLQAWGGGADALEASALSLLELDPECVTVSARPSKGGPSHRRGLTPRARRPRPPLPAAHGRPCIRSSCRARGRASPPPPPCCASTRARR